MLTILEYSAKLNFSALIVGVGLCCISSCTEFSGNSTLSKDTVKGAAVQPIPDDSLSMQNNVGGKANDFVYLTEKGERKRMHGIGSVYTLLFFYNPECDACKEYKQMLSKSKALNEKIASGHVFVLAVYIDKDLSVWKRNLPEMPKNWMNGRDEDEYLFKNKVYDLNAIPTIYLLDRDKKVLLKDVLSIAEIEDKLR